MSYPPARPLPSHLRGASTSNSNPAGLGSASANAPPLLVARVNEKRIELENLRQLRDLSAQLAAQMEMLEEKLSTLANGTEAVATVMGNWHSVLSAISMASMKIPKPKEDVVGDAKASDELEGGKEAIPLPQTLVRIPAQESAHPTGE